MNIAVMRKQSGERVNLWLVPRPGQRPNPVITGLFRVMIVLP